MSFLLKEFIKYFFPKGKRARIGFVVSHITTYNRVLASTRIRVYDIIKAFDFSPTYCLELYRPFRTYDIVIFLKTYDEKAITQAKKLQEKGVKVVFDININIFEPDSSFVSEQQSEDGKRFANLSDAVITNSPHTLGILTMIFPDKKDIYFIEEPIHNSYFNTPKKKVSNTELIWIGYKHKAQTLYSIKELLLELYQEYSFSIKVICEEDPKLDFGHIPVKFCQYDHGNIGAHLSKSTVFIAPRDINDSYNLGHSFTKIGIAMAVGLPVIASPLPAYRSSPAILCENKEEWKKALMDIFEGRIDLERIGLDGKAFCSESYGIAKVKKTYNQLFNHLMSKQD